MCGRMCPADRLFLKASGGPVFGTASVADVKYFEGLTPERIAGIRRQYGEQIRGDNSVWDGLMDRKSGFLVWLADVRRITPIRIDKKDWRAWVLLTREKDFGLLKQPQSLESDPWE